MIGSVGSQGSAMLQAWQAKIAAADADQSGGLSLDEFTQLGASDKTKESSSSGRTRPDPSELFSKLDTDGDGQLSTTELTTRPPRPAPPSGSGGLGDMAMSLLLGAQEDSTDDLLSQVSSKLISSADTNGDGGLSLDEYQAKVGTGAGSGGGGGASASSEQFDAADTNKDGVVSADELAAQLGQALQQAAQRTGKQAYDQLLKVFSDYNSSADSSGSVSIAA